MTLSPIDPALRIASVHLAVSDLARSIDFYERVLGLPRISSDEDQALLGPDGERALLRLTRIAHPTFVPRGSTGLFHVAYLYPTRQALAEGVLRVAHNRWPIDGVADHGVSEAIYLSDPDGLGIEIYVDRPREQWSRPASGHGVNMVTLPLDLDDLLTQASAGSTPAMPSGTGIGHVHLKVADVARSSAFYRDALGLEEQAQLPSAAFLSAGGYHHHIGLNSWHSQGGAAPPDTAPDLRLIEFELSAPAELDVLEHRLGNALAEGSAEAPRTSEHMGDRCLSLRDPNRVALGFS
ncbi:MAG TPA: VOC family protein [Solirubrobacteraceae bacterium]|jgi:catechol 2,3-dioxygenase